MQIITPITIDLINPYPLLNFNLKQGDSGRGILVTVTANGANVEFTTETVNIYVKKPDGTIIYNACTVSGNQVRAMFTNHALAVAGNAQVELEIISQDDTISTPIACINILPTNIDSEAIESSNEFTALTEALNKVAPSVEAANTAAGAANQAAVSANAAAKAANDIAEEVQEKLENGDFVGPPGPPGSLDNVTGAATSILTDNLTASRALVSDGNGKVAVSAVTATELGYLDGVTSGIQSQLDSLNSNFTYKEFVFYDQEVTSGTPGTRAAQITIEPSDIQIEGYTPISAVVYYINTSLNVIAIPFVSGSSEMIMNYTGYINLYRASGSAATVSLAVRFTYIKSKN